MKRLLIVAFLVFTPMALAAPGTPVVVELFTSEGCESCPPADVLLQRLESTQPVAGAQIIPLSLHVDYWDQLGWKDRFSSAAFTSRQRLYGTRLDTDDIYTPQMVVDGRLQFVGSDDGAARKAIAKAATAAHGVVRIERRGQDVEITATELPAHDRADVVVAVVEDRLRSNVTRGENRGRTLTHTAVVRTLLVVGEAAGRSAEARSAVKIDPSWKREDLRIVAFVQERRSGAILASTMIAFEPARP